MAPLWSVSSLIALLTLTGLEIVLGIDNVIFLSIITSRLPRSERRKARVIGLSLALLARVALLLGTEGDGLSRAGLAAADTVVTIPMSRGVDSLNVAAASAVALWALRAPSG